MKNQVFKFKQFIIREDSQVMKVGTDSILLGSWVSHQTNGNILDIGAGNGILSLILAQKNPKAHIQAVDISKEAVDLCKLNFQHNSWADRMLVQRVDIQEFQTSHLFDLIISNPPYFESGITAPNKNRARARHNQTLSFDTLLLSVNKLLKPTGYFYLVLPYHSKKSFLELSKQYQLSPNSSCDVSSYIGKVPHISLICLGKNTTPSTRKDQQLFIFRNRKSEYTKEFKMLTKDFYL